MNFKRRFLHCFAFITLSLAFFLLVISFYWLYWPYKVIEVKSPAKVFTKTVMVGESLIFEVDFCSYTDKPAQISRRLINGVIFTLPTISGVPFKGCKKDVISSTIIPETIPGGIYILEVSSTRRINPLRYITVTWETEGFHVIKPYGSN